MSEEQPVQVQQPVAPPIVTGGLFSSSKVYWAHAVEVHQQQNQPVEPNLPLIEEFQVNGL